MSHFIGKLFFQHFRGHHVVHNFCHRRRLSLDDLMFPVQFQSTIETRINHFSFDISLALLYFSVLEKILFKELVCTR